MQSSFRESQSWLIVNVWLIVRVVNNLGLAIGSWSHYAITVKRCLLRLLRILSVMNLAQMNSNSTAYALVYLVSKVRTVPDVLSRGIGKTRVSDHVAKIKDETLVKDVA